MTSEVGTFFIKNLQKIKEDLKLTKGREKLAFLFLKKYLGK